MASLGWPLAPKPYPSECCGPQHYELLPTAPPSVQRAALSRNGMVLPVRCASECRCMSRFVVFALIVLSLVLGFLTAMLFLVDKLKGNAVIGFFFS